MLKFFVGFVAAMGFAMHAMAVDVEIVENDGAEAREEKPYVLSFDGQTEVSAAIVAKIIACNKHFDKKKQKLMNEMFEHRNGIKDLQPKEQLTLSNRELNESFVRGALKDCLSK